MAEERQPGRVSRRAFLHGALALAGTSVLGGCGEQQAAPTQPAAAQPGATTAPAAGATAAPAAFTPAAPQAQITYVAHDPMEPREQIRALFNEQFPNIQVNLQQIPQDFPTKIFTMAAANQLPEVARVWEPHVLDFGRAGRIIDLGPRISSAPEFNEADFLESLYNFPVIDGKRYGVPDGWNGHLCFYNRDVFAQAGVPEPGNDLTWDAYVDIARQLSKPDQQIWGSDTIPIGWLHWNYKLIWQNGGQVYSEDYSQCLLDSPEAAEALQYWADLLQEAQIMPSPTQAEGLGDLFQSGKVAMQRMGTWVMGPLSEGSFKWNMVPEPKQKERRTLLHTAFNVIPTSAKDQDAAWSWLNFIVSPEPLYIFTESQATPAARRSVNERSPWVRENIDANWDLVPQAGEYGILVPAPPNVGEAEKLQTDAFQAIYLGQGKAADVLKQVAPQVTAVLQRR